MNTIENFAGNDIIDVRDIIARVEELRGKMEEIKIDFNEGADEEQEARNHPDFSGALFDELKTLESLLSDLCGNGGDEQWEGDWYPVTLIKNSYFEESMDEMVADCYPDLSKDLPCFVTVTIDYDALKQDYQECDFEGDTYYYR